MLIESTHDPMRTWDALIPLIVHALATTNEEPLPTERNAVEKYPKDMNKEIREKVNTIFNEAQQFTNIPGQGRERSY